MKFIVPYLFFIYSASALPIEIEETDTSPTLTPIETVEPPSLPVIEDIEEEDVEYTQDDYTSEDDYVKEQNKNAKYSFGYRIQDEIKDGFIERQEERNGLAVRGQYSYSDGYFHHTVTYVADENGYRVTNMETKPVNGGKGPVENKYGRAIVQTLIGGVKTEYAIQNQKEEEVKEDVIEDTSTGRKAVAHIDAEDQGNVEGVVEDTSTGRKAVEQIDAEDLGNGEGVVEDTRTGRKTVAHIDAEDLGSGEGVVEDTRTGRKAVAHIDAEDLESGEGVLEDTRTGRKAVAQIDAEDF